MTQSSFYDLLEPGMKQHLGSHTFDADEIIEFATEFDPQKFHLSEEGAQDSHFGHLCASGWHTLSVWMRFNVDNGMDELLKLTGYDGPRPIVGPSPGVRNIKWLLPVYVGDTISYVSTITEKRKTPKRPGWGMVMSHSECFNQNGKCVAKMDGAVTMRVD